MSAKDNAPAVTKIDDVEVPKVPGTDVPATDFLGFQQIVPDPKFGTPEKPVAVGDAPAAPQLSPVIDTDGDLDAEPIR